MSSAKASANGKSDALGTGLPPLPLGSRYPLTSGRPDVRSIAALFSVFRSPIFMISSIGVPGRDLNSVAFFSVLIV